MSSKQVRGSRLELFGITFCLLCCLALASTYLRPNSVTGADPYPVTWIYLAKEQKLLAIGIHRHSIEFLFSNHAINMLALTSPQAWPMQHWEFQVLNNHEMDPMLPDRSWWTLRSFWRIPDEPFYLPLRFNKSFVCNGFGVPIASAIALFALWPAVFVIRRCWPKRSRQGDVCPVCGYDVRTTPWRCSECGTAFDLDGNIQRSEH